MDKKFYFLFRILLFINILTAIPAILLLLLQPSEAKGSLLLDYSGRKILMVGIIVIIVVFLILIDRLLVRKSSYSGVFFGQSIRKKIANKVFITSSVFLLALIFCYTLTISIYMQRYPANYDAQLFHKVNGFIYYFLIISFSSLLIVGFNGSFIFRVFNTSHLFLSLDQNDPVNRIKLPLYITSILLGTVTLLLLLQLFITPLTIAKKVATIISPQFMIILIWIFLFFGIAYTLILATDSMRSVYELIISFLGRCSQSLNKMIRITHPGFKKLPGFIILIAFVVGFWLFAHPRYGVNDDYNMMLIASGKINGVPDAHIIFSNVLIGSVLAKLYGWFPGINWYTWYLTILFLISSTLLIKNMRDRSRDGHIYFANAIALCLFFLTFIWGINFTVVSILTSFIGYMTLIGESENKLKKGSILKCVLGIVLIITGGLVRLHGMLLTSILVSPYLIYLLIKNKKPELVLSLIMVGGLSGIGYYVDQHAYISDPGWKFFQAYNIARGKIYDTPRLSYSETNKEFWQEIGWGSQGYNLFRNAIFIDPQVFTLESLQKINQEFPYEHNDISKILSDVLKTIKTNPALVILIITNAIFSFIIIWNNKKQVYLLSGLVIWFALVYGLLAIFQRIPDRLVLPGLFILNYGVISLFQSESSGHIWTNYHYVVFLYLLMVGLIALVHVISIYTDDQNNKQNQTLVNGIMINISSAINQDPKALVVIEQRSFMLEQMSSPFSSATIPFEYLPTGWLINSPPYLDVLNARSIDNPINALYLNKNIYFLGTSQQTIAEYLYNKYKIIVTIHRVWNVTNHSLPFSSLELVQFSPPSK